LKIGRRDDIRFFLFAKKNRFSLFFERFILSLPHKINYMDVNEFKLRPSQIIIFFLICAGLYYITESFFMALGIMVLLIIGNYVLADWIGNKWFSEKDEDDDES